MALVKDIVDLMSSNIHVTNTIMKMKFPQAMGVSFKPQLPHMQQPQNPRILFLFFH